MACCAVPSSSALPNFFPIWFNFVHLFVRWANVETSAHETEDFSPGKISFGRASFVSFPIKSCLIEWSWDARGAPRRAAGRDAVAVRSALITQD